LYSADLSGVSVTALQYTAGIYHVHEAQLIALYVESDPENGFSFDRPLAELRQEWLQDRSDGLAEALVAVHRLNEFGKPELRILEVAAGQQADLVVLGAPGLGTASGFASDFLDGTACEVVCSSKVPGFLCRNQPSVALATLVVILSFREKQLICLKPGSIIGC